MQDANNQFRTAVNAALAGEPQRATRRGKPAVVVLVEEGYQRLRNRDVGNAPNFIEYLLTIPKATDDDTFELPPRTSDSHLRRIDF